MTQALINVQLIVLTYLCIGFFLYKIKMIDSNAQSFLSNLVLNFLLPVNVFASFVKNITFEMFASLGSVLLLGCVFETILYGLTRIPMKGYTRDQRCVAQYSYMVSNGGLIGTPVIEGLYGGVGVMFCNIFLIPTRILAYSAGESIFNPELRKSTGQIIKATLTNKVLDAIFVAMAFKLVSLNLPAPVFSAIDNVGKCLSPFSLILIGSMLAQKVDFHKETILKVAQISFIRLLVIPMVALAVCCLLKFDFQSTTIVTLLMGMPAASTGAIYAKKYNGDTGFASTVVFVTTILSTGTLIGLMAIMDKILL